MNDEEIGRIRISDSTEIIVKKTEYEGQKRIDIRKFITSEKYTGWTKQGIAIPEEKFKEFISILSTIA